MKKFFCGLGIAILVALVALGIWQRENLRAIYQMIRYSPETIAQKEKENENKLIDSAKSYFTEGALRDFTPEERQQIESGERTELDVMVDIMVEQAGGSVATSDAEATQDASAVATQDAATAATSAASLATDAPSATSAPVVASGDAATSATSAATPAASATPAAETADAIVSRYVAQLNGVRSSFVGQLDALAGEAKSHYVGLRKTMSKSAAISSTLSTYTSRAAGLESSCDAQVDGIIASLRSELNAIGADTSICTTIRQYYSAQKANQKAAYLGRIAGN